jgi:glycosyltransferase involved in cell wall biosynthesis
MVSTAALTVLFATRNGERVLSKTLEAYCRVNAPIHPWKLVVVDNGSQDLTHNILASFGNRLPLQTMHEPTAGKNRALNHGLTVCEGRLVIVTDDDAIPDPSFLTAWEKYLDQYPDYEIFGGSIDLHFEVPPPSWMLKNISQLDMMFAVRNLPEGPITADAIFGPNMAVRSSVFENGFRFNENIGPNGSDPDYPMGSETEFCCRVAQNGVKAWFAKEPRVQHIVRSSQLTSSYWAKRAYRHGRGVARRMWESGQAAPPRTSRPLIVDHLSVLRHRLQMFAPFPRRRFNSIWAYHWRRGFRDEQAKRQ